VADVQLGDATRSSAARSWLEVGARSRGAVAARADPDGKADQVFAQAVACPSADQLGDPSGGRTVAEAAGSWTTNGSSSTIGP
jgi:hypothetical protein